MVEVEVNTLSEIIGNKTPHRRIPYLGERVWIAEEEECDVIYWDAGNGMCQILQINYGSSQRKLGAQVVRILRYSSPNE